jgi:hypothetical protein
MVLQDNATQGQHHTACCCQRQSEPSSSLGTQSLVEADLTACLQVCAQMPDAASLKVEGSMTNATAAAVQQAVKLLQLLPLLTVHSARAGCRSGNPHSRNTLLP